ncbi:MAG: hypothetical protein QXP42_04320 [Candidatus Micrarchaeia archaeon]
MNKLERAIKNMVEELRKLEEKQDETLREGREITRMCANAVKKIHARDIEGAGRDLEKIKRRVGALKKVGTEFPHIITQTLQEYAEIAIFLSIVKRRDVPTHEELGVDFADYILGLCDVVGELKREMLEELRAGNVKNAEYYFTKMNEIYEATLPLRFSDSILPGFRKKQDAMRYQLEQARGIILEHSLGRSRGGR